MVALSPGSLPSVTALGRFLIPDLPEAEDVIPYLRRLDETRWYSNFGPLVLDFEEKLLRLLIRADRTPDQGSIHLTTLVSGHHALEVALHLSGITRGKKVLLPAVTFPSCPLAVQHTGGEAVLADIDRSSWTLTPQIARAVASRTQIDAIMPVAIYGVPVSVGPWDHFSRQTGIPIIIDAAAAVEVQQVPRLGVVAHSFHATKPFGIGEGGLLASRDADLIERTRRYTNFGTRERICWVDGSNAKMSEYHGAVGLAQVNRWNGIKQRRADLLRFYVRHLAPLSDHLSLQPGIETAVVSLLLFRLKQPIADTVLRGLANTGIATHTSYLPPLYRHPHFSNLAVSSVEGEILPPETDVVRKRAHMVGSEEMLAQLFGVPFHSFMSEADVISVIDAVSGQLQKA